MAIETPLEVMASTKAQSNRMDVGNFCELPDESGGKINCTGICRVHQTIAESIAAQQSTAKASGELSNHTAINVMHTDT
jgi:hypothetical protein